MNFVSYKQLLADLREWSTRLPDDLVAVAGVPRSGMLPACHLAMHRNIHLATLEQLEAGARPWERPLRRSVPAKSAGHVLIVDDSLNRGGTLESVRRRLGESPRFLYGAVYYREPKPGVADLLCRRVPLPRCFEWNLFHSSAIESACLDLDGVICEEPPCPERDGGPELHRWMAHLTAAVPRFVPSRPVKAIVTSRLEKYRPQTEYWLKQLGIRYGELVMSPHATAQARRSAADHARRKGEFFRKRTDAALFVESSPSQAAKIARHSGKPVICTENMEIYNHES